MRTRKSSIKIKKLEVSKEFSYLWLKGVNDVDLSKHCARSLIGQYSLLIDNKVKKLNDVELEIRHHKAFYLCGVSKPFNWYINFHLAFKEKEGAVLEVNRYGIHIILENAEEIKFSEKDVDMELAESKKREYYTCRNWQFANKFKKIFKE